jgi:hypothetical protein
MEHTIWAEFPRRRERGSRASEVARDDSEILIEGRAVLVRDKQSVNLARELVVTAGGSGQKGRTLGWRKVDCRLK